MTDLTIIAQAYVAAWNATEAADRKRLMQAAFTGNASYRDPHSSAEGQDRIDAMIAEVHKRFPGYSFSLKGTPDGYADVIRFSWAMANGGAESLVEGTDIGIIEDGRLAKVTGFLDKVPVS